MLPKLKRIFNRNTVSAFFPGFIPRPHHLSGTFLHGIAGESLFDPRLWKPTKVSISGGLAVGIFVALTPTMEVQYFLTIIVAYFLRVNIPAAVAACWITNPLTAPIIYPLLPCSADPLWSASFDLQKIGNAPDTV